MNAMKQLYAAIALSPFCIFPFYADEAAGDNNIALGNEPTSRENTAQANLPEFDGWSDERLREYEDSLVNALFPTPAIVEISPDSIPKGVDKAPNINNNGLLTGYAHIPDSREIDASCVVGDIPVSSGVSQTGGRTFEILSFPTVYTDKKGDKSIQPKFYYPGDYNGDGKMEILAMSAHEPFGDAGKPSVCYIFDLEGNRIMYQGSFLKLKKVFFGNKYQDPQGAENSSDKLLAMDIDGDGKTDLVHITEGSADVYTFDVSGSILTPREVGWHGGLKTSDLHDRRLLVGDFNNDGCSDIFITPPYNNTVYPNFCSTYLSMGNGRFDRYSVTIDTPIDNNTNFLANDINGDGLTDILKCSDDTLTAYINKKGYISESIGFDYGLPVKYSIPVAVDINTRNSFSQVVCLKTDEVYKLTWNTDERIETLLSGLVGSLGTVTRTYYSRTDKLDAINEEQIYLPARDAAFPYVNLLEPIPVVGATEFYLSGESLGKDIYSYTNAVVHRQGLGLCGFQTVRKTDARNRSTVCEYEPYRHGLPKSVAAPGSEASFTYSVKTGADRTVQFNLDSKTEKDLLKGTTATSSYTYDPYGFPLTETTTYSDGYKTAVSNIYSHTPTAGKGYILGLRKSHSTTYSKPGYPNTTDSRTVAEFSKGLPLSEEYKIDGATVSKWVFAYDDSGQKVSETVTPYSSTVAHKTEYGYNPDGLLISETDELGLETAYSYNAKGQTVSKTDIRGGVTTYTYDGAGRESSAIRPDGTEASSVYRWVKGNKFGVFSVTRTDTGRPQTEEIYDALGRWACKSETRFDGSRMYVYREFDPYGNVSLESEPYMTVGTTPYKRSYSYDMYGRPLKCTGPGTKETTWSYSGSTVTVKGNGVSTAKTYDTQGYLTKVSDPSGTLVYELDAVGNPRSITAPGNVRTSFTYDGLRRRKTMTDPSQGTVAWTYDNAGNVSEETNANGQAITYSHDIHNRITERVTPEFTSKYTYDPYGALKGVSSTNGTSTTIVYDTYGRIRRRTESGASRYHYRKEYTYSSGNVGSVTYSVASGGTTYRTLGKETYSYANGHLTGIQLNDSKQVYRLVKENPFGQTSEIATGGITRTYTYSGPVFESGRKAMAGGNTLLELSSSFDEATSSLLSRTDEKYNLTETFGYDGLNRLVSYGGKSAEFDSKGNVLSRSETGSFSYGLGSKPYALTGVVSESAIIPHSVQQIGYTSFSRPSRIEEDGLTAEFTYNSDFERVAMSLVSDTPGASRTVRYLGGNFESVFSGTSTSATEERLYLGGDYYDAPAVYVRKDNKWTLYYILRDYLGSVMAVVDESGNAVERMSYDAWGNLRDPQTHKVYEAGKAPGLMLGRGYTGHEHLPWFGLVNMNARLYDPALGRFLSPDPYVQSECGPQGFNRYSYCLNNPLLYIDEDGEMPLLLAGTLLGGCVNLVYKACSGQIHSAGDAFAAFGIGAVAGLAGTVTGGWAFGAAGGGFLAGAAAGGIGTATDMYLQSLGNHAYFGGSIISTKELLIGTAFGAITAGAINGSVAVFEGKNFWTGEMIAEGKGQFSFNNPQIKIIPEPEVNSANSSLSDVSPNVREIADKLLSGKRIPLRDYQEVHFVIEEGGYKMDLRVETQAKLDRVFKSSDILKTTKVRHMNVQLYKWNGIRYDEIPVPGYGKKNYHLFLNIKK